MPVDSVLGSRTEGQLGLLGLWEQEQSPSYDLCALSCLSLSCSGSGFPPSVDFFSPGGQNMDLHLSIWPLQKD